MLQELSSEQTFFDGEIPSDFGLRAIGVINPPSKKPDEGGTELARDKVLQLAHFPGVEIPRETGRFRIESSIGPKDEGVKAIYERQKEGVPIHFYELTQGMVDYGKVRQIQLYLKDGSMVVWDGTRESLKELKGKVKRMSFYNTGAGLAPENTAISLHLQHSGAEKTLGTHGVGTTNSLTYLTHKGAKVTVESNYEKKGERRRWSGSPTLQSTESEIAEVLVMEGKWGEVLKDETQWNTSFKIEGSDELMNEFLDDLGNLSDSFLFTNPMYPGACLVPKNSAAPEALPTFTHECYEGVIVECLDPIFPPETEGGLHETIYVDGLRLRSTNPLSLFQWSIRGLSDNSNKMDYIGRSKDSSTAQDSRNISRLIELVVEELLRDKKMLRKLILFKYENPNRPTLELGDSYSYFNIRMDDEKAEIIRDIWQEIGNGAKIANSEKWASEYNLKHGSGAAIYLNTNRLYDVFKKAGVPTVESELVFDDYKPIGRLTAPFCPKFRDFNDGLDYFFAELGKECGDLDDAAFRIEQTEEGAVLKVIFPQVLDNVKNFLAGKEENHGLMMRLAFNLVKNSFGESEQPYAFFKKNSTSFTKVEIDCQNYEAPTDNIMFVEIGEPDKLSAHVQAIEPNKTHLFIPLPDSKAIDLARLKTIFKRAKAAAQMRLRAERRVKPPKVVLEKVSTQPIGIADLNRKGFDDHPENVLNPGFHRTVVRNKFIVENGVGYWQENDALANYPVHKKVPNSWEYTGRVCMNNLNGEMKLPVEEGERLVAIVGSEGSSIQVYRDVNTGTFFVAGQADHFWYYTGPDDPFDRQDYEQRQPTNEDLHCSINLESLSPEVKEVLAQAQSLTTDSEKLNFLLNHWLTHFVYDSSPELDELRSGETESQVITQIVNAMRGQCNYAGTSFAQALRFLGIPARVMSGCNVNKSGQWGAKHMKVQAFIGGKWITVEPTPARLQAVTSTLKPKWHETVRWGRWAAAAALALTASLAVNVTQCNSIPSSEGVKECSTSENKMEGPDSNKNSGIEALCRNYDTKKKQVQE